MSIVSFRGRGAVGAALQYANGQVAIGNQTIENFAAANAALFAENQRLTNELAQPELHVLRKYDRRIVARCEALFAARHFDNAVFDAMKVVEDSLRSRLGVGPELYGVDLVNAAFGGQSPKLSVGATKPEHDAIANLFRGAIGAIRNPLGHRFVELSDPIETLEMIGLANRLIRYVDAAK